MRLRIHCRSFPASLMFNVLVLLHPVSTQTGNINRIYFLDKGDAIVLTAPDNPGNGSLAWEWKPHSGQYTYQLGTFTIDNSGIWRRNWNYGTSSDFYWNYNIINLIIQRPDFNYAGLFTLIQTQQKKQILTQYEIFGIKVETSSQRPVEGSDVTLSCTISRLPDTVSLHWKPVGSSQQNRRNTDQIRLNNTVYLMLRHVTVEDGKLYQCEVWERGNVVFTSKADFTVNTYLYQTDYTLYRPSTDYSELHLLCYSPSAYSHGVWTWSSRHPQAHQKQIASGTMHQPINVSSTDFRNRLVTSMEQINGMYFNVRITPVLFGDAGVYTCSLGSTTFLTIELITVKVTAVPSDTVTERDTVTLSCSVSNVTASTRLVWINEVGVIVGEKTLNEEEKSLSLIIYKAERGRVKWTCGVFDLNRLRILVPYYQELSDDFTSEHIIYVITRSLVPVIFMILTVVFCRQMCKLSGLREQRPTSPNSNGNRENKSYRLSNLQKIQQMQDPASFIGK